MSSPASAKLAIDGGPPVRAEGRRWPGWPVPAPGAEAMLREVLHSGRWAISSPYRGELYERRFARAFAEYVGARHCVPTDHGSSALVIALQSIGLKPGDVVLVPALTWTASATAVFRAGLLPVLVDVDPDTGCIGPEAIEREVARREAAATGRPGEVRAVIAVHWACSMADIPAIEKVASARGITVIEDAAQAHGARWSGRSAGSLGRLGCFSMQHAKVLTCGEGGAVVTSDDELAPRLEELRADSRRYGGDRAAGRLELIETATIMGSNYCLGEFGAAVLCAQLEVLDQQHEVRNRNYDRLCDLLAGVPDVRLPRRRGEQDRLSLYEIPLIFDPLPDGVRPDWLAAALSAELGVHAYPARVPLHRSPLLQPWTRSTLAPLAEAFVEEHRGRAYPGAEFLSEHVVQLHHSAFLGDAADMDDLAAAVAKVVGSLGR